MGGVEQGLNLLPDFSSAELRLELSNICNHACIFCPNRLIKRTRREMSPELVKRLLDEGSGLNIKKVGLFMNGEPFVSQRLEEWVEYANGIGYEYIYITTNGALATPNRVKSVMENGCSSIKFSINAGSRTTYKIVHQRDDYEKVIDNVINAYKIRETNHYNCKLLSSFVVTKFTEDEIEYHYKKIKPYVDEVVFFNCEDFAGQMGDVVSDLRTDKEIEVFPKHILHNSAPCKALWNSINITCEGYLTLCCSEAFNYLVVEDMNKTTIKEAWYSNKMIELRKKHIKCELDGLLCNRCITKNNNEDIRPINEALFASSISTNC